MNDWIIIGLKESEVGQIYAVYSQWINNSVNTLTLNDLMNKLHVKVTPFTRKSKCCLS
jgi:hypothetical protein